MFQAYSETRPGSILFMNLSDSQSQRNGAFTNTDGNVLIRIDCLSVCSQIAHLTLEIMVFMNEKLFS